MRDPVSSEASVGTPFRVLFVCTGNTCRSPLAEALALREIERRGWRHVAVASAGVAAEAGMPASAEAIETAREAGLDLRRHRSQPVSEALLASADLILTMGRSHLERLQGEDTADRLRMLGDFVSEGDRSSGVVDPYGGSLEAYREALQQLEQLVPAALDRIAPIVAP